MIGPALLPCGTIAAILALAPAARAAATVTVDLDHTSAAFSVRHLTITHVTGSIPVEAATLAIGPGDIPTSVAASFDLAKLTTQNDQRDDDLKSAHWFDVASTPEMTFVSTKIVPGASGAFVLDGDLTMHGVTKPVELAAKIEGKVTDKRGTTHVGYSATGTIDRTQWNVGSMPGAIVGSEIALSIELEAIEK